jgi:hypothetical protein
VIGSEWTAEGKDVSNRSLGDSALLQEKAIKTGKTNNTNEANAFMIFFLSFIISSFFYLYSFEIQYVVLRLTFEK